MRRPIIFLALAALLLPALAGAQPAGDTDAPSGGAGQRDPGKLGPIAAQRFKKADTNGDGKLSRAEAQAGMPLVARNFDAIDTDHDGFITPEELRAAMQRHRDQTQAKSGGNDSGGSAGTAKGDSSFNIDDIPK